MRNRLISVAELPELEFLDPFDVAEKSLPSLAWNFALPSNIDAERIQVDMTAIRRLNRVAGLFGGVVLSYEGETTEFTPAVAGVNGDGSAIATKAGVTRKADLSKGSLVEPYNIPPSMLSTYGKPFALHNLNKPEIVRNVVDGISDRGLTREQSWADQLDKALFDSYRNNSKLNLISKGSPLQQKIDSVLWPVWGAWCIYDIKSGLSPASVFGPPIVWAGVQAAFATAEGIVNKLYSGDSLLSEKRWSIFYSGHQTDRYIALKGLTKVSNIFSVRD